VGSQSTWLKNYEYAHQVIQIICNGEEKYQEENIISRSATSHSLGNIVFVITDKTLTMRDMIYRWTTQVYFRNIKGARYIDFLQKKAYIKLCNR